MLYEKKYLFGTSKKEKKFCHPFYNYRLNRPCYYINQFCWYAFCGLNLRQFFHSEGEDVDNYGSIQCAVVIY
jgi:hypothetical protein